TPYVSGNPTDKLFRRSVMGLGFNLHFGRIYKDVELVASDQLQCVWYYVSPDGNEHALPAAEQGSVDPCQTLPADRLTVDRTFYRIEGLDCGSGCVKGWNGDPATQPAPV